MRLNNAVKIFIFIALGVLVVLGTYLFYPNVKKFQDTKYFYVRNGYTLADVDRELITQHIIKRPSLYRGAKRIMGFGEEDVHVGRYKIPKRCSNFSILNRIRRHKETPVKYEMSKLRPPPQIVNLFYQNTQSTERELQKYFYDPERLASMGCDSMSLLATFFREEFEELWSKDFRKIEAELHHKYKEYWSDEKRQAQLDRLDLTQREAMTLASIVQGEILHDQEAGTVAQVYLNRLHKGMKLQADPTVIYAMGDFEIRRVKKSYLRINSPFNTYRFAGLPPGPIFTVRREIVDSVLYSKPNDYIFFCADPDKLGYHRFTQSYERHLKNAADYQAYLDQKNIK